MYIDINLINEKIFFFVWCWLVGLALAVSVSFLGWMFRTFYWRGQAEYFRKHLEAFDSASNEEQIKCLKSFIRSQLRGNGMFAVQIIGRNVNEVISGELLNGIIIKISSLNFC